MLFSGKRRLLPALFLFVFFAVAAVASRRLLDLEWSWRLRPLWLVGGLSLVAVSDGLLHGLLWLFFGRRYLERYRALALYFSSQGGPEIVIGGVLAAGEEVFFRGVLLQGAIDQLAWNAVVALFLSALSFGLLHLVARPALSLFALWAFWEGVLLGSVYLVSGSLLTTALVHALHDVGGFVLFSYERRTGWLAGGGSGATNPDSTN